MAAIVDLTTPGDLAKEIRARIADLNELVVVARKRNVHVEFAVITPDEDDEADGMDYEVLEARCSQRI